MKKLKHKLKELGMVDREMSDENTYNMHTCQCSVCEKMRARELGMDWIAVKDRMPEDSGTVLVFIKDYFDYGHHHYMALGWMGDHWRCGSDAYHGIEVTHWMPLPEQPTSGA